MSTEEYRKLLRDWRWQRFRDAVLRRDDYTCQECGRTDLWMTAHHNFYEYGKNPWEYPIYDEWPHAVDTVCIECHPHRDEIRKAAKDLVRIADQIKRGTWNGSSI